MFLTDLSNALKKLREKISFHKHFKDQDLQFRQSAPSDHERSGTSYEIEIHFPVCNHLYLFLSFFIMFILSKLYLLRNLVVLSENEFLLVLILLRVFRSAGLKNVT